MRLPSAASFISMPSSISATVMGSSRTIFGFALRSMFCRNSLNSSIVISHLCRTSCSVRIASDWAVLPSLEARGMLASIVTVGQCFSIRSLNTRRATLVRSSFSSP